MKESRNIHRDYNSCNKLSCNEQYLTIVSKKCRRRWADETDIEFQLVFCHHRKRPTSKFFF